MRDNKILNLGAGSRIMDNAINIDIIQREGIDIVCDIQKGLPFEDNKFERVIADYVLCQILEPQTFKFVMNEIWRILKPDAYLEIRVPDARYPAAFQDPMDCRRFVRETFDYFNKDHYRYKVFNYGFKPWTIESVQRERDDRLFAILKKHDENIRS